MLLSEIYLGVWLIARGFDSDAIELEAALFTASAGFSVRKISMVSKDD
jgi:hypothetical protein